MQGKEKKNLLKRIFLYPSQNISLVVPLILVLGFVIGLLVDTSSLKKYILTVTVLMIYPTMIGFRMREVFNLSQGRLVLTALVLNFLLVPFLAYLLGVGFLLRDPELFAGLAITSLLPTSNMTIAFTMLAKGNVPGAIKLTTTGLLLGSLLAPWYLLLMVGKYVPVNVWLTLKTIALVILLPLFLGVLTYAALLKKYSPEDFQKKIKPSLPAASAWGMLFIIFASISMNAPRIASHLDIFGIALLVQVVFYSINYVLAVVIGRSLFEEKDALALVFSTNYVLAVVIGRSLFEEKDALALVFATVLRNLSISIGLAATAFGPNAALMVSLAFLIQQQAAAWFIRLNEKYSLLNRNKKEVWTHV